MKDVRGSSGTSNGLVPTEEYDQVKTVNAQRLDDLSDPLTFQF